MNEAMKPQPQKFEPIETEPAYQTVSRTIEQKIVSGEIKIGEPLPDSVMPLGDQP